VKTKQPDQLYRALKDAGKTVKEIWHLGAHATVWDKAESNYFEYHHLWMDHFVYGLDNGAVDRIPEINMPNHNNVNWESYDSWPIAGSTDARYYFGAPTATKAGALLAAAPPAGALGKVKDNKAANAVALDPGKTSGINNGQLGNWESRMFGPDTVDAPSAERLAFATGPLKAPLRINGTVRIGLELSSDTPWGSISAVLVELGPNCREFGATAALEDIGGALGTAAINLNNYTISSAVTQYHIVTRGCADIQNPNPARETYLDAPKAHAYVPTYCYQTQAIAPGARNQYYFDFMPMDYTFKAGTRLAVFVYGTDYRATIVPLNPPTLTLYSGANSFVELPIVPTYGIIYDANGGTGLYDALGGFSDAYPVAGQSAGSWNPGYRVATALGDASVAKLSARGGYEFVGWNTSADGSGAAFAAGDRIPDAAMGALAADGVIRLYAQWALTDNR